MARREQFSIGQLRLPNGSAGLPAGSMNTRISVTLTPAAVGAATVADQNLTVNGVEPGDAIVCVQNPIVNATALVQAKCATANTLALTFVNPTAGSLTPTTGTYVFLVFKQ